jgi:ABC-2 type transport system permease protein
MAEAAVESPPAEAQERWDASSLFVGTYVIWLRDMKRFWRDTPRRIGLFFQPLIYLFILGIGLQSAFRLFGSGDTRYVTFIYPGIIGMTVLFTAVFSAISIIWDRQFGFLKEVMVAPTPRSSMALGKVLGGGTTAFIQGGVLLALAFLPYFLGFSLSTLLKVLALIPVILIIALSMTSLGVVIAARMRSFEGFPIVINFILLPMFFLSGAMFPLQGLPGWMNVLTKIDPLTYAVDAIRGITLAGVDLGGAGATSATAAQASQLQVQVYPLWLDLLVVVAFGALLLALSIRQFNKQD